MGLPLDCALLRPLTILRGTECTIDYVACSDIDANQLSSRAIELAGAGRRP